MIGFMINSVLPGRVGEVARPVILKKQEDIPFSTGLATVAAERVFDVIIMIILGVMGWALKRFGFTPSPIVLGLILSSIAEQGFVQGWTIGAATENLVGMFFGRPIAMGIIAFILLSLFYPVVARRLDLGGRRSNAE